MKLNHYNDLHEIIQNREIIKEFYMEDFLRLENQSRCGKNIVKRIQTTLQDEGFSHIPNTLPKNKKCKIRIYKI